MPTQHQEPTGVSTCQDTGGQNGTVHVERHRGCPGKSSRRAEPRDVRRARKMTELDQIAARTTPVLRQAAGDPFTDLYDETTGLPR